MYCVQKVYATYNIMYRSYPTLFGLPSPKCMTATVITATSKKDIIITL